MRYYTPTYKEQNQTNCLRRLRQWPVTIAVVIAIVLAFSFKLTASSGKNEKQYLDDGGRSAAVAEARLFEIGNVQGSVFNVNPAFTCRPIQSAVHSGNAAVVGSISFDSFAAVIPMTSSVAPAGRDLHTSSRLIDDCRFSIFDLKNNKPTEARKVIKVRQGNGAGFSTSSIRRTMTVTAYCPCRVCCGKWAAYRTTASGHRIRPGDRFVAAAGHVAFGTRIVVPGYHGDQAVEVRDRGRLITGNRLDVFFHSHREAVEWGVRRIEVTILPTDAGGLQLSASSGQPEKETTRSRDASATLSASGCAASGRVQITERNNYSQFAQAGRMEVSTAHRGGNSRDSPAARGHPA